MSYTIIFNLCFILTAFSNEAENIEEDSHALINKYEMLLERETNFLIKHLSDVIINKNHDQIRKLHATIKNYTLNLKKDYFNQHFDEKYKLCLSENLNSHANKLFEIYKFQNNIESDKHFVTEIFKKFELQKKNFEKIKYQINDCDYNINKDFKTIFNHFHRSGFEMSFFRYVNSICNESKEFEEPKSFVQFIDFIDSIGNEISTRIEEFFGGRGIFTLEIQMAEIGEKRFSEVIAKFNDEKIKFVKSNNNTDIFLKKTKKYFNDLVSLINKDIDLPLNNRCESFGKINFVVPDSRSHQFTNKAKLDVESKSQNYEVSFKSELFKKDIIKHFKNSMIKPLEKIWLKVDFKAQTSPLKLKENFINDNFGITSGIIKSVKEQMQQFEKQKKKYLKILTHAKKLFDGEMITKKNIKHVLNILLTKSFIKNDNGRFYLGYVKKNPIDNNLKNLNFIDFIADDKIFTNNSSGSDWFNNELSQIFNQKHEQIDNFNLVEKGFSSYTSYYHHQIETKLKFINSLATLNIDKIRLCYNKIEFSKIILNEVIGFNVKGSIKIYQYIFKFINTNRQPFGNFQSYKDQYDLENFKNDFMYLFTFPKDFDNKFKDFENFIDNMNVNLNKETIKKDCSILINDLIGFLITIYDNNFIFYRANDVEQKNLLGDLQNKMKFFSNLCFLLHKDTIKCKNKLYDQLENYEKKNGKKLQKLKKKWQKNFFKR